MNSVKDIENIASDSESNYLLKSRRFGYDGKNQLKCDEEKELYDLRNIISINTPLNSVMLEDICATSFHDKSFFTIICKKSLLFKLI